jgi:hypothetical protein
VRAKAETLKAEMLKSERAPGGLGRVRGRFGCNPCLEGVRRGYRSVNRLLTGFPQIVQSPKSNVQSLPEAGWRNLNPWEGAI